MYNTLYLLENIDRVSLTYGALSYMELWDLFNQLILKYKNIHNIERNSRTHLELYVTKLNDAKSEIELKNKEILELKAEIAMLKQQYDIRLKTPLTLKERLYGKLNKNI